MDSTLRDIGSQSACSLCALQDISKELPLSQKEEARREIFHKPCQSCDSPASRSRMQLCVSCQHLRIRHLFVCIPEQLRDILSAKMDTLFVDFQPYSAGLAECDFCRLLIMWGDEHLSPTVDERHSRSTSQVYTIYINRVDAQLQKYYMLFPGGHTFIFADRLGGERKLVHPFVDWTWLKYWLEKAPKTALGTWDPGKLYMEINLKDVRAIDVMEKCVAPLPINSSYVALSYVWGQVPQGRLHCTKSNVEALGQPRALATAELPRTIADALTVCQQLGFRYLWVDSLCIIQDESLEKLTQQLDQMASIYNRATLTLVAAAGHDAAHGLAGVSYARNARQHPLRLDDGFELVGRVPYLGTCFKRSTWSTRGWTYQEYVASQRLLIFTDYGLYQKSHFGSPDAVVSEGAAGPERYLPEDQLDLKTVEEFTKRSLTYPTDILRASAGILQMLYKNRLLFGMPLDEFDSAILWAPTEFGCKPRQSSGSTIFPSWSWASSSSPVSFPRRRSTPFGLAYYGSVCPRNPNESVTSSWEIISPSSGRNQAPKWPITFNYAGLAWLNGCVKFEVPSELLVNIGNRKDSQSLWDIWQTSPLTSWHDARNSHETSSVFDGISNSSFCRTGCLAVHAQKISFALDLRAQILLDRPVCMPALIRAKDSRIVGSIELDNFIVEDLRILNQANAIFIALSVDGGGNEWEDMFLTRYMNEYYSHLDISDLYGCACASDTGEAENLEHFVECPKHADFSVPGPDRSDGYTAFGRLDRTDRELACTHYLAQQSYYDSQGKTMHEERLPPFLWVMMIAPSENARNRCVEQKVYRRLGIGKIWLKKWVEAEPVFETFFLE
jgi:hypothetical protein